MSNVHYIHEAREHLERLREQTASYGGPCWKCRFGRKGSYSWERTCKHPLVRRGKMSAVTGKVTWVDGDQSKMREQGGLCAPEGKLFEKAPILVFAWRAFPKWIFIPIGVLAYMTLIAWATA